MKREIIQYPSLLLTTECAPVTKIDGAVQNVIRDLHDTATEDEIAVGLSAPQIGELMCIAVVHVAGWPRLTLINPVIVSSKGVWHKNEGCLSVRGMYGYTTRSDKIAVTYMDEQGKGQRLKASGFLAQVIQHEIDHLNGVMFWERMQSADKFVFFKKHPKLAELLGVPA